MRGRLQFAIGLALILAAAVIGFNLLWPSPADEVSVPTRSAPTSTSTLVAPSVSVEAVPLQLPTPAERSAAVTASRSPTTEEAMPAPTAETSTEPKPSAIETTPPVQAVPPSADENGTVEPVTSLPSAAAIPVWLQAPTAGISEPKDLLAAGLSPDGKINPPPGTVMWFDDAQFGNVPPGQLGTGVIAGHVVYGGAPDVFSQLSYVAPGDEVKIGYSDGSVLTLRVVQTDAIGKDDLTQDVRVWNTQRSVRRVALVTCSDVLGYREDGHRKANFLAIAEVVG